MVVTASVLWCLSVGAVWARPAAKSKAPHKAPWLDERRGKREGNTAIANILRTEGTEYLFCFPANALIEPAAVAGIKPIMSRTELHRVLESGRLPALMPGS